MTETMVEKVGLAIRVARWEWVTANAGKSPEWPHVPIDVLARAAIEAMREPDLGLLHSVLEANRAKDEPRPIPVTSEYSVAEFVWGEVIAAILSEPTT